VRMPRSAMALLALGLVAASQSGNLVRIADAHPVVIAGWRLLLAAAVMLPIAAPRLADLRGVPSRLRWEAVLAGLALGAHLVAWIAAVQRTTVANAATFFCINPLLTAIAARVFLGERVTRRLGFSLLLGLAGVLLMGLHDLRLSPQHLEGDLLSILCSALFTVYLLAGRRVRASMDNRLYVLVLYGVAGVATLSFAAVQGLAWLDPSPRNWLAYGLLALVPTLLGHTFLNHSLRWLSAARLSLLTLTEPAFAGLVAWWAWGEAVSLSTLGGYLLVALSVVVLLWEVLVPGAREASGIEGRVQTPPEAVPTGPVRLRPHHLGCIAGFTGHGYDGAFTANLSRVARMLERDPGHPLILVSGPDDLCAPCPHRGSAGCARDREAENRVRAHDQEFLEALGLDLGDRTSLREFRQRLDRDEEGGRRIQHACSTCPWTSVCVFYQRLERR